jgi:hypothetical protein
MVMMVDTLVMLIIMMMGHDIMEQQQDKPYH